MKHANSYCNLVSCIIYVHHATYYPYLIKIFYQVEREKEKKGEKKENKRKKGKNEKEKIGGKGEKISNILLEEMNIIFN